MIVFKFEHLSSTCFLVRMNERHIGWVDGKRDGKASPLNAKQTTIQFRATSAVINFDAQNVVTEYCKIYRSSGDWKGLPADGLPFRIL